MGDRSELSTTFQPGRRAMSIAAMLFCVLSATAPLSVRAQTFSVLHSFTGAGDGGSPLAGLTIDQSGNLYGTAAYGGADNYGTVFKLAHKNSAWELTTLHSFAGGQEGAYPEARVVFGPQGKLYGTTQGNSQLGTVFSLVPPSNACRAVLCPWTQTVLYDFAVQSNGLYPNGDLIFDQAGNIYGTTWQGGSGYQPYCAEFGCGTVFELSPDDGGWSQTLLYAFYTGTTASPGGLVFDTSGNLYGPAGDGGLNWGAIYELTPGLPSWSQTILYNFLGQDDGGTPAIGLLRDAAGNLYGLTSDDGAGGGGTVFELSPGGGTWTMNVLFSFTGYVRPGGLSMDAAGNLYGTTLLGGTYQMGNVFRLTPSNGSWIYASLYDFTGGADGGQPVSNVIFDAAGNLYGTAFAGGTPGCSDNAGCGVVWEITP